MEYPEEIYATRDGGLLTSKQRKNANAGWGRRYAYWKGHVDGFSKAMAKPLEGYSNFTAAIRAGKPIDWEKLDGLKVQCVNPDVGTLHGTLKRETAFAANTLGAWWDRDMDDIYGYSLTDAWHGRNGWTLWIEGEIPLRRKTADQLEAYTYFYGEAPSGEPDLMYVGGFSEESKAIYYAPEMYKSKSPASEWVVLEEYGTFQKPEGK